MTVPDPSATTLDRLDLRVSARVVGVAAPEAAPQWSRWLADLGFVPGEEVQLLAYGPVGRDPLVVRVGASTFALRRDEAACIRVATSR